MPSIEQRTLIWHTDNECHSAQVVFVLNVSMSLIVKPFLFPSSEIQKSYDASSP